MNRIILIGNGFDLAHGLKTSYRDFIDDYWKTFIEEARKNGSSYEDDYVSFKTNTKTLAHIISGDTNNLKLLEKDIEHFKSGIWGGNGTTIELSFKNSFLEQISKHVSDKSWVDIENEYYEELKKCSHDEAVKLNEDFAILERLLIKYIAEVENKSIKEIIKPANPTLPNTDNIKVNTDEFYIEIGDENQEKLYIHPSDKNTKSLNELYLNLIEFNKHLNTVSPDAKIFDSIFTKIFLPINISDVQLFYKYSNDDPFFDDKKRCFSPKNILLLNFNYTHTSDKYIFDKDIIETIHIHGELNNPKNPIIFGYGDELAEDYRQIENLNDNEYLKNVKSIRYLETDNYRKMLSFIESEPYQIFIMGHSCGNSDRTLLNTLFEHKNCVSIKPFFHQREDGSNNYNEIVQNISRNFTNKAAMRERVVNKTYCERLT